MASPASFIKDKNRIIAAIIAILLHSSLLLLLLFVGLSEPFPKIEEIGMPMRIRLGSTETGMGETVEPEIGNPAEITETSNPVETTAPNIATQTQQTVAVKKSEDKQEEVTENPVEKPVEAKKQEEEKQISDHLKNMLNKYKNKSPNQGGSYGDDTTPGNQGSPDGHPDGGPTGGDLPGGGSWKLAGRAVLSLPKINDKSQDEGKVVVDIVVDRNGDVIKATAGGKGSTTTSSILYMKAREAAFKTKFSPNPNAPLEQHGQMTFVFILR